MTFFRDQKEKEPLTPKNGPQTKAQSQLVPLRNHFGHHPSQTQPIFRHERRPLKPEITVKYIGSVQNSH